VANPLPLVVLPGDDAVFGATASMTNEDPDYPATNLLTGDPALVAKSTTTSTTVTLTTASLTALALGLINTNATTITFNGNSMPIASLDPDGQRIHPWLDRRSSPITASSWVIALSVASGVVWLGRPVIAQAVYDLNLKYGLKMGRRRPGDVEIKTRLGSIIRHGADIRTRWATGSIDVIESEALLKALDASAKGSLLPFLFIPDEATNDAWFVRFTSNEFSITIPNYDVREIPFSVEEVSSGPPNG
jgi:hypothetical protein